MAGMAREGVIAEWVDSTCRNRGGAWERTWLWDLRGSK